MTYDERLAERVRQWFVEHRTAYEEKRMMGGLCFMVDGKMCVGVEKQRLMARIDPNEYEAALGRPGGAAMDFTGRPMRGFVFVNAEGLVSERSLAAWLALALEFNPLATSSKRKSRAASAKNAVRRSSARNRRPRK